MPDGPLPAPATNGRAYPDHRPHLRRGRRRRRGRRPAGRGRLLPGRPANGLPHQGLPDALPYRRRAGRHLGGAREHGPGRLALPHVRHREGVRLARRPGRHRVSRPQCPGRRLRARALGRAVLAHRGRPHLPAPVRRDDDGFRQGDRPAHLRRRRPNRPRDPPHALRRRSQARRRVLRRIFRHRPHHGRGGRMPRGRRAQDG